MKRIIFVVGLLMAFVCVGFAADSYYLIHKRDSRQDLRIKLLDNGDGTYSTQSGIFSVVITSTNYAMHTDTFLIAPDSMTFVGTGLTWSVEVTGGNAVFNVNNSSTTGIIEGWKLNGSFGNGVVNATIYLESIDAGATFYTRIEGAKQ